MYTPSGEILAGAWKRTWNQQQHACCRQGPTLANKYSRWLSAGTCHIALELHKLLIQHVQQALAEPGQGLRGSDTVVAAADVSAAALSILQLLLLHPAASVCGRSLREQTVLDLAAAGLQSAGYIRVCVQDATAFLPRFLPHARQLPSCRHSFVTAGCPMQVGTRLPCCVYQDAIPPFAPGSSCRHSAGQHQRC